MILIKIIKNALKKKNQVSELLKNRNGYEKERGEIKIIMIDSKFEIYYIE